jgi:hypothetical protein
MMGITGPHLSFGFLEKTFDHSAFCFGFEGVEVDLHPLSICTLIVSNGTKV